MPFLGLFFDLRSPMFEIHEPFVVEFDVYLAISNEIDRKWLVTNDSLVFVLRSIRDKSGFFFHLGLHVGVGFQASNERPFRGFVVPLFPSLTVMSQLDIPLLSFLLVYRDSGNS